MRTQLASGRKSTQCEDATRISAASACLYLQYIGAGLGTTGVLRVILTCTIGGWAVEGWAWRCTPTFFVTDRMDVHERAQKGAVINFSGGLHKHTGMCGQIWLHQQCLARCVSLSRLSILFIAPICISIAATSSAMHLGYPQPHSSTRSNYIFKTLSTSGVACPLCLTMSMLQSPIYTSDNL